MSKEPIIKIKNLNVTYFLGQPNEVRALRDINLDIYPGEFVVFFGPSGCGKSTLLYSITGLEENKFGSIFIDKKNIVKLKKKELEEFHQKKTGMIFQAYYLINSLSVLMNVTLPQVAIGISPKQRKEKAKKFLKKFGIEEQAKKLPNELSGGQQQRVAICRALINDPDILFADEPVGNLDSKSASEVMKLIKELNEKEKKTVILVTHNPANLSMANRVFYMRDGEIIDVKVNKDISGAEITKEEKQKVTVSKDLELLARTFSNLSDTAGNLLLPFKAREIVLESLTDMTSDQISYLEDKVENLLSYSIYQNEGGDLLNFLDKEIFEDNVGLNRRTAEKLTKKIENIVGEIKLLMRKEIDILSGEYDIPKQVDQIREYLFDSFEIKVNDENSIKVINRVIEDRLLNRIDRKTLQKRLDLPAKKGGAAMDKRQARKMAQRFELLILGKFK